MYISTTYDSSKRHTSSSRRMSSIALCKSVEFLCSGNDTIQAWNFKLSKTRENPLVILLAWFNADRKHIHKYAYFYLDRGFDALVVICQFSEGLLLLYGVKANAGHILSFLDANRSTAPILIHGFSVGGFVWEEVLVRLAQNELKYADVVARIRGQIWDSVASIETVYLGVADTLKIMNPFNLYLFKICFLFYLCIFYNDNSIRTLSRLRHYGPNCPALIIFSKVDRISTEARNMQFKRDLEKRSVDVRLKCFSNSPHVRHMEKYPSEYFAEVLIFLRNLKLAQLEAKL